jgi:hypothetical protein
MQDLARTTPRAVRTAAQSPAELLAAHVPLSLLLDIADPTGPHSRELLAEEPGSADWLRRSPDPAV